jgi:hypothetical protein
MQRVLGVSSSPDFNTNPITQDIVNNGFSVRNTTLRGHMLHSNEGGGEVLRTVYIGASGAAYSSTIARGSNYNGFLATLNVELGEIIFRHLDSAMARYIRSSGICN